VVCLWPTGWLKIKYCTRQYAMSPQSVAYKVCGYKQAGQTDGRADGQAGGPNRAKIVLSAILARVFLN